MTPARHAASLQPLILPLVVLLCASAGGMWWGASQRLPHVSAIAAFLWVSAAVGAAVAINKPVWRAVAAGTALPDELRAAARRNARLVMLVYAWGATALMAVYGFSSLRWQHGLQYASGMALIGGGILLYVRRLEADSPLATSEALHAAHLASLAHGLAAAAALVFLVSSGKLTTGRGDWAANHVFLAGGLAILLLTALAAVTHARLVRGESGGGTMP
jgi:hypothetical protein